VTARSLLLRGMLVGAVGGLLAIGFGWLFGEPQIDSAIAFEAAHTPPGADEAELVSRTVQSTLGLGVAVLVYGAAFGGIFALAFAFAYGRIGRLGARATAVVVAAVGFVAFFLVPFVKYPANPPAVGNPDTIGDRTALYVLMIVIAVSAAVVSAMLGRSLAERFGAWNAAILAGAAFLAVVGVAGALLPAVNEVPADFSATVLWRFRLASLGTQLVLWTTFGLLFGALTERAERRRAATATPVAVG
jgi:hypothetical protein